MKIFENKTMSVVHTTDLDTYICNPKQQSQNP